MAFKRAELTANFEHFTKHLEALKNLKQRTDEMIDSGNESIMDLAEKLLQANLKVESLELEARIKVLTYHVELYRERIEMHEPVFEKDSAEANANWDKIYSEAEAINKKYPVTALALVLANYPKDNVDQELKNEAYKAMLYQVTTFKKQNHLRKV